MPLYECQGTQDHGHLGEEYDQTEDRELGPVEDDNSDEDRYRRIATRELDCQNLKLPIVDSYGQAHHQTSASGNDREKNR